MQTLQTLIDGYQSTCILVAAVRLGIFEALADQPRDADSLADTLHVDPDNLRRLVRILRSYGLVSMEQDELALTDQGLLFAPDSGGIADQLRLVAAEYMTVWSQLELAVTAGKPIFETIFGETPWEHRRRNPLLGDAFNRMTEHPQCAAAENLVVAYDFSRFPRIADIGGGRGYLLSRILARHPRLSGVLLDLPAVIASAGDWLREAHVDDRCVLQKGSFFERVPGNADLYILQYVLHDWDDERCDVILRNCRAAMRATSRLVILEKPLPHDDTLAADFRWLALRDLHMMLVHGGRERTLEQYETLLKSASLERTAYLRLESHLPDVIEARPS